MALVNRLSTGFVITGAYADKIRKTLFAQTREYVKKGLLESKEVARAAGEINRFLFDILVNGLSLDKGDVVRIRIEYSIEEGRIHWHLPSLTIEAFRRIPDSEVMRVVEEAIVEGMPEYTYEVKLKGKSAIGDEIYEIEENGKVEGVLVVTRVGDKLVVRGALLNPPRIIEKQELLGVDGVEEVLRRNIKEMVQRAKPTTVEVAEKVIKEIEDLIIS